MLRSFLKLLTFLIEDFKFLGFSGGFWLLTIPLILLIVYVEKSKSERDKLNATEDFSDQENADELPLFPVEFRVSSNEKWQIGQVLKRMNYNTVDDLIRDMIQDLI